MLGEALANSIRHSAQASIDIFGYAKVSVTASVEQSVADSIHNALQDSIWVSVVIPLWEELNILEELDGE